MKKCNNKTSFLLFLPFAQSWQSFSVLGIWFIWWPPSESPGALSHSPLKARGDLLQPCRAGGVHSQGVSSTLIARRSCGYGKALLALGLHFVFSPWVCKESQSVREQKSKEPEHVDRAGRKGGEYGKELFGRRAHNHGYVFVHMWVCRRGERPACGLEVMGKFRSFDFDSFSEDSSRLPQFTEELHYSFSRLTLWEKPFCEFLWYFSTHWGIHRYEGVWEQSEQAP